MPETNAVRLSTKLAAPIIRTLLVRRGRLVERLRQGMNRRLSLVIAPAGYGKTTLIGEWLASLARENWPVGWVSLDADDNNPLRFWNYVAGALDAVYPAGQFQDLPHPDDANPADRAPLIALINRIAGIPMHFSLVLDDFHLIEAQGIQNDVAYLVTRAPEHFHLVIASRMAPKFPLSELRVKNQLVEIGARDLTFDLHEGVTFLREVMGIALDVKDIAALLRITEGWAAGLQMAALSIKGQPNARSWIDQFDGSQHYIFDYLTETVLANQPESIQHFLLKTSILPELTTPLCNHLLDIEDSQKILDYLEKANLFLVRLDEKRQWYRYHALFADMLKLRLEREHPHLVGDLRRRACAWLKDNGLPEKAIPQALAAGDLEMAAEIIEASAVEVINRFDFVSLRQWINLLPEPLFFRRPMLWVYRAVSESNLGRFDNASAILRVIKESLASDEISRMPQAEQISLQQQTAAIQATVDLLSGNLANGIALARQAMENLPPGDRYLYGWLNCFLGFSYETVNDLETAVEAFNRSCEFGEKHALHASYIFTRCQIARIRKIQGRLRQAEREYHQALDYAAEMGVGKEYALFIRLGLAETLVEQNKFAEVDHWVNEAADHFDQVGIGQFGYLFTIEVYTHLANYFLITTPTRAKEYLHKARRHLPLRIPFPYISAALTDLQVRIWLAEGDFSPALRWVEKKTAILEKGDPLPLAAQVGLARIFLAQGKPEAAYPLLVNAKQWAEANGLGEKLIEVLILESLALNVKHAEDQSLDTFTRALALAEPENYLRLFINEGVVVKLLLSKTLQSLNRHLAQKNTPPSKRYLEKMLAAFEHSPQLSRFIDTSKSPPPATLSTIIDPLTERELEVLAYLRDGKSTRQVSDLLVVSVNTTKVHIRNIFQKLDAHNRQEALDRAAQLKLLD